MQKINHPAIPKLHEYWTSLSGDEKEDFAKKCNTNRAWMRHIIYGHGKASHELATAIEKNSFGRVKREQVRPDIYGY